LSFCAFIGLLRFTDSDYPFGIFNCSSSFWLVSLKKYKIESRISTGDSTSISFSVMIPWRMLKM
jgi:hypothetical protein